MFDIEKYKDSNVKLSIRLPESIDNTLRKIAEAENMSFNNVLVSCIKYALDNTDLTKYEKKIKVEHFIVLLYLFNQFIVIPRFFVDNWYK